MGSIEVKGYNSFRKIEAASTDNGLIIPIPCLACAGGGCRHCQSANCAICLCSSDRSSSLSLQCGHTFCAKCLQKHAQTQLDAGRAIWCPLCCKELCHEDVATLGFDPKRAREAVVALCRERDAQSRLAQHAFRSAARDGHWKLCPRCQAPIIKDGGGDQVRCRCGHRFSWEAAQMVEPCRRIHWNEHGIHAWGHTCRGCSPIATLKLVVARTLVCLCAIPIVIVLTGIALIPAAVCAPLALMYEPLRRLKVSRSNPFLTGVCYGPLVVVGCGLLVCQKACILTLPQQNTSPLERGTGR